MKRRLLSAAVLVALSLGSSTALAANFGPIRSNLQAGQLSAGLSYAYDAIGWEMKGLPAGFSPELDTRLQQATVLFGLGLGKGWQGTLRAGSANIDANDFKDNSPIFGATLGGPVFTGRTLSIGPFVSADYVDSFEDPYWGELEGFLIAQGGLTFQLEIEGANLYFGPLLTVGRGEATDAVQSFIDKKIEPEKHLAAFAGIRWPLPANWPGEENRVYLDLEARFTDNFSAGTALNVAF